jgi:DUF4097 and DUF4098 domain-containing protein YvlB
VDEHTHTQEILMTEHHFDTPRPIELFAEIGKGSVTVDATDTVETTVRIAGRDADQVLVRQDGRHLSVVAPKQRGNFFGGDGRLDVSITMPIGSDAVIRTGSADITVNGTLGTVQLKSGSGDLRVDTVTGPLLVETGSGDIRVDAAQGHLKAKSGSGDVTVGASGAVATVSTGSGDVRIDAAQGPASVKTGSGDLEVRDTGGDLTFTTGSGDFVVGRARRGKVTVKGASGDVTVAIPAGTPVWTDISTVTGDIRSGLDSAGEPQDGADHVEVRARTVTGDITLAQA